MTHHVVPIFLSLFGLAIVWLVSALLLFRSLEERHPAMHQRIGSPRGFEPQAGVALLGFLLTNKPESLGDRTILLHAHLMRVILVVHLVGFGVLVYSVGTGQHAA
ncbi:hypothetical protein ACQQ2N_03150 [Dokdonella sp. MW10]|uniref:hypothetical protein n=1 Tax=Dokdonella sp. MW10 TaxID=2992926 RepID=UPI003F81379B